MVIGIKEMKGMAREKGESLWKWGGRRESLWKWGGSKREIRVSKGMVRE